jgi:aspartyl-tRNA synthetase
MKVDGGAKLTRKEIDELTQLAISKEAKGLAYIIIKEGGELQSPIVKFLGDDLAKKIVDEVGAKEGDIIFFAPGRGLERSKTLPDHQSHAPRRSVRPLLQHLG